MSSGGGASDPSKGLLTGMGSHFLTGWASPTASSPKWRGLDESDACPGWVVWGDKFALMGERRWVADYGMYIAIAVRMKKKEGRTKDFWYLLTGLLLSSDLVGDDSITPHNLPHVFRALHIQERYPR